MMGQLDQLTIVCAVDAVTSNQWAISLPTIATHRPELLQLPWLIIYDDSQVDRTTVQCIAKANGLQRSPRMAAIKWPIDDTQYWSQRAKMVSSFVFATTLVETPWWMKIDTDAIALHSRMAVVDDEWFTADCVVVAPRWGYTKPKGDNRTAVQWAESLESFGDHVTTKPRLNLAASVNGNKISRKRFCSWLSFYRTEWTRQVANLAFGYYGECRIPVPSQDTFHWYMAERMGDTYLRAQMKRRGWTNVPRIDKLKEMARQSLAGEF